MKKRLALAVALIASMSLASCGGNSTSSSSQPNTSSGGGASSSTSVDNRKDCTVVFLTGIDLTLDSLTVKEGEKITAPTFEAVPHYSLEGWYKDEEYTNRWDFEKDVVTETTILYAKWNFEPYEYEIKLPSTHLLPDATEVKQVADAPELLILEVVYDTSEYFHAETMAAYEYVKVFNNTTSDYNMKDHRLILSNPLSGLNGETEDARKGLLPLVTNYLFMGYIDEDFVIPALSCGLLWMKPYYWTAGSGSNAFNKTWSPEPIHTTTGGIPGAMEQDLEDFYDYWELEENSIPVCEVTNMGIVGKRALAEAGTEDFYPIYSPGSGTMYTHLNSKLIRSLEIQKFDDNDGEVTMDVLNKYDELTPEKQANPDFLYGKQCFNVCEMRLTSDNSVVNGYDPEMIYKYFDPIIRTNFCGRIDTTTMTTGQTTVSFTNTSNPGVGGWDNCVGQQYRPPLKGERVMQWQLPVNELRNYTRYMNPSELACMRFCTDVVTELRFATTTVYLKVDPSTTPINWRSDEIKSPGRLQAACPGKIKAINLEYPQNP